MRSLAVFLAVLGVTALGACEGGDPAVDGPEGADKAPGGRDWRMIEPVTGPQRGGPSARGPGLTPRQIVRARRILARDPWLTPVLGEAGGHEVKALGPITTEASELVGALAEIKLDRPVSGDYRFPGACVDMEGRFLHAGDSEFRLRGVDALMVEVGFAEGRVFEAQPSSETRGRYEVLDWGDTWPQSCADRAKMMEGA